MGKNKYVSTFHYASMRQCHNIFISPLLRADVGTQQLPIKSTTFQISKSAKQNDHNYTFLLIIYKFYIFK
jgi:hypothetical protein